MDDRDDGKKTHDKIECDMYDDITLFNMPIKKDKANGKECDTDDEVFFEICLFQKTILAC